MRRNLPRPPFRHPSWGHDASGLGATLPIRSIFTPLAAKPQRSKRDAKLAAPGNVDPLRDSSSTQSPASFEIRILRRRREDEDAARACGINVASVKLSGTAISAALTAGGGALFAMYVRTIDPPSLFSLADIGFKFALLTLIGTIAGPVLGAFLTIPIETWLRATLGGGLPGRHLVILGFLMLLAALFMRKGLVHAIETAWKRWQARKESRKGQP